MTLHKDVVRDLGRSSEMDEQRVPNLEELDEQEAWATQGCAAVCTAAASRTEVTYGAKTRALRWRNNLAKR
jgi:hypothetical protein